MATKFAQYDPAQMLDPNQFMFGAPNATSGTLATGYGSLPGTGAGAPAFTNMNGFYTPPAYAGIGSNWAGAASGMGGRGAVGSGSGSLADSLAGSGFGFNMGTAQLGLDGLKTIGGLYGAYQANKLANEQFDFSKKFAQKNLTNQTQSYNDRMADTLNARGFTSGTAKEATAVEIERRKLSA